MKTFVALVFAVFVVCVTSENCTMNSIDRDCAHEICSAGFHKDCVRNLCTCTVSATHSCITLNDCTTDPTLTNNCNRSWHCVDNKCRCGGNFGGRPGGFGR